jgi:EmrB/QacA subfamily drug resistance transporter
MNGTQQLPPRELGEPARLHGWGLATVLIALMLTLLLAALDQTIVSTALPTIIGDLHGFDRYTWVVTAYLLTETTVIPIVGKLSDQFGRKWFVIAGVIIFLIGSALSGASQTMNQLIAFRGVQGIGAGFLFALIFTLIGDIFTPAERARWQGLFSGVFGLASVIGPTLGGWITDHTTWRWVFYVNLPLGIIALLMLFFGLPTSISVRTNRYTGWAAVRRIDVVGALTAAGATVCLLLGLTWGGVTYPWDSAQVIGILAAAAALYITFIVNERFFAVEPILPLDLFKNQVFAAGALLSLTVGMALFAVVIYLPLFIQGVLGQSATNSGAVVTPLTLTLAFGAAVVGQVIARVGRYQFIAIIGAAVLTLGVVLLTRMDSSTSVGEVTRDMIVVGLGLGMLQPVLTLAVQNAIPRSRLGVGTSAVTYLRTMGQTLGVAIIGSVVTNTIASDLAKRLPTQATQLPPRVLGLATSQQVLINPGYRQQLVDGVTQAAVQQAVPQAVAQATAHVPPGPAHAQAVATITAQVTSQVTTQVTNQVHTLLGQIFDASRQSLATGIQHAFVASLIVCAAVILITFFMKDIPLVSRSMASHGAPAQAQTGATPEQIALASNLRAAPLQATGTMSQADRTRALAGVSLAMIANEALRPNADAELLASLSSLADGKYPHEWSAEERGRAVARDLIEPMAVAALMQWKPREGDGMQREGERIPAEGNTAHP